MWTARVGCGQPGARPTWVDLGAVTEPRGKWTHGWRLRVGAAASVFHDRARVHTHASRTSPRAVVIAVSTVDVPGAGSGERQTVWAGWRVPANEPRRDGGRLEDDDPRPGGDGGRRERLRGGRADPTQRLRGVQPPRVCSAVAWTGHGMTRLQVDEQGAFNRNRAWSISMPQTVTCVEWMASQHADNSRRPDTPSGMDAQKRSHASTDNDRAD
jgi:hypothetical protein